MIWVDGSGYLGMCTDYIAAQDPASEFWRFDAIMSPLELRRMVRLTSGWLHGKEEGRRSSSNTRLPDAEEAISVPDVAYLVLTCM